MFSDVLGTFIFCFGCGCLLFAVSMFIVRGKPEYMGAKASLIITPVVSVFVSEWIKSEDLSSSLNGESAETIDALFSGIAAFLPVFGCICALVCLLYLLVMARIDLREDQKRTEQKMQEEG